MKKAVITVFLILMLAIAPIAFSLALTNGTISLTVRETEIQGEIVYWNITAEPSNAAAWDVRKSIPLNVECVTKITVQGNNRWIEITPHWYVDADPKFDYTRSDGTTGSYSAPWDPIIEGHYKNAGSHLYLGEESTFRFKTDLSLINWLWENLTDVHEVDLTFNVTYPKDPINISSSIYGTVEVQPASVTFALHLNLDSIAMSYFEHEDIANSWNIVEGCGDGYIDPTKPFSAVFYGVPESTIKQFNETIYKDSSGVCYISEYSIFSDSGLNWTEYENATPSEIYSKLPYRADLTVANDVPSPPCPAGVGALYAGHGFIVDAGMVDELLHEFGHACGFCDPDPWGDLKTYWRGIYVETQTAKMTNATWFIQSGDYKLWIIQKTTNAFEGGKKKTVTFSIKANKDVSLKIEFSSRDGSFDTASKSVTLTTSYKDVSSDFIPEDVSSITASDITLHFGDPIDAYLTYPILIYPSEWNVETTSGNGTLGTPSANSAFWQKWEELLNKTMADVDDPQAMAQLKLAQYDLQKAKEAMEKAEAANSTSERMMYEMAANQWLASAEERIKAASAYDPDVSGYFDWFLQGKPESHIEKAEDYEQKATQYETQAELFQGESGASFAALLAWLESGMGSGTFYWLGFALAVLGFVMLVIGSLTKTRELRKLGSGLLALGLIIIVCTYIFGGVSLI